MKKNIDKLLNKYLEGATSLTEEEIIRDYFVTNKNNLPEKHKKIAPIFTYINNENEFYKNNSDSHKVNLRINHSKIKYSFSTVLKIAAMLIFFVSIQIVIKNYYKTSDNSLLIVYSNGKLIKNKQLALSIAQNKLSDINLSMKNINSAINKINVNSHFNELNNNINSINKILKANSRKTKK